MKEYETKKIPIKDIKMDGDNPNAMDKDMSTRLSKSMEEFGNTQDIIVDSNTMILADGEHRLQQYIKKGINEIPVKLVPFKDDAHRRAYRQAANKIRGQHSKDLDMEEYLKIIKGGQQELLKMATGLRLSEVEKHLRTKKMMDRDEDFDAEKEAKNIQNPTSKPGDIFELGEHRLMCGDSTKEKDVSLLMDKDKAHLIFTDPPYNVNYAKFNKMKTGGKDWHYCEDTKDDMKPEDYRQFLIDWIKNGKQHLIPNGHWYIWYAFKCMAILLEALEENKIHYDIVPLIWKKQTTPISWARYLRNYEPCIFAGEHLISGKKARWFGQNNEQAVWEINTDSSAKYVHQTQKPVDLSIRAIGNSTEMDEIVLDLFGGSGSTMIGCEKTGRKARIMERDPVYCDVIIKRWEEFTEQKAVKYVKK